MMTKVRYARKCDNCSKGMNDGYVWGNGEGYACNKKCLYVNGYKKEDFARDYENDVIYWTDWDESQIDEEYYYTADGELIEGIRDTLSPIISYTPLDDLYRAVLFVINESYTMKHDTYGISELKRTFDELKKGQDDE